MRKLNSKQIESKMKALADTSTTFTHDGGDDERIFLNDSFYINIFASDMTKKQYDNMETDINTFRLKGEGYEVYAWNDCSGYKYWSRDRNGSNYIQITAGIIDVSKINIELLEKHMIQVYDMFASRYDNTETHDFSKQENE